MAYVRFIIVVSVELSKFKIAEFFNNQVNFFSQGDRAEQTSDFDSVSTTSASYVLNHSDLDSLLNDNATNLPEEVKASFGGLQSMESRARSGGDARAHDMSASSAREASKTPVDFEETTGADLRQSESVFKKSNFVAKPKKAATETVTGDVEPVESNNEATEPRRKKSSVSQLIAKFENQTDQSVQRLSPLPHLRFSRSVTPDRSGTSPGTPVLLRQRSSTPDQRPASAAATLVAGSSSTSDDSLLKKSIPKQVEISEPEESEKVSPEKESGFEPVTSNSVDLNDNPVEKESLSEPTPTPTAGGEKPEPNSRKESGDEEPESEAANDEDGE